MRIGWLAAGAWLALAACGDTIHGVEYAEPVVERFRERMKAGQFERMFAETDQEFKAATRGNQGVELFAAVDRKLGKLKHAALVTSNVKTHNGLTLAVLVYNSEYERGAATETFTVRVDDGKGSLVGYNIQSLDMLLK